VKGSFRLVAPELCLATIHRQARHTSPGDEKGPLENPWALNFGNGGDIAESGRVFKDAASGPYW